MSRYCNKDIKAISIETILVTFNFENGFSSWDKFGKHHPEMLFKISEICKENICGRVSL